MISSIEAPIGIFADDGNKPVAHGYGINGGDPLAESVVAYWPMWEGAGSQIQDVSERGNRAPIPTTLSPPHWVPARFGPAFKFNRINNNSFITTTLVDNTLFSADFTISAWVFQAVVGTKYICGTGLGATGGASILIVVDGRIFLSLYTSIGDLTTTLAPAGSFPVGEWVHVLGTRTGNTAGVYVNGVQKATSGITNTRDAGTNKFFTIGSFGGPTSQTWIDQIDSVVVWGKGLTADEVSDLCENPYRSIRPSDQAQASTLIVPGPHNVARQTMFVPGSSRSTMFVPGDQRETVYVPGTVRETVVG